jgi:hypothetical protein
MNLSKERAINRLCRLTAQVNEHVFDFAIPADCLCRDPHTATASEVISFIEDAVHVAVNARRRASGRSPFTDWPTE